MKWGLYLLNTTHQLNIGTNLSQGLTLNIAIKTERQVWNLGKSPFSFLNGIYKMIDFTYEISWKTNISHPTSWRHLLFSCRRWSPAGKSLPTDVKSPFHLSPEHCHLKSLDVERLALCFLSEPRKEQVMMVLLCCGIPSGNKHQTQFEVRWCTPQTSEWCRHARALDLRWHLSATYSSAPSPISNVCLLTLVMCPSSMSKYDNWFLQVWQIKRDAFRQVCK